MWPDIFHKINRRVAQALNHPECAELKLLLKQAMKLFRFSRAPFSTGRFGQMISEARVDLLRALKAGEMEELVDMWLSVVAKDRGVQDDSMSKTNLIQLLERCTRTSSRNCHPILLSLVEECSLYVGDFARQICQSIFVHTRPSNHVFQL